MAEWEKIIGEIVVKHGKEFFKKRRIVWTVCLVEISSGVLLKSGWLVKWSLLELYVKVAFLVSTVALVMWFFEFIWVESQKKKESKRVETENENRRIKIENEKESKRVETENKNKKWVKDTVESFSLKELEFLMGFDEKSKRTTVFYENQLYLKLLDLGVVDAIAGEGDLGVNIKINEGYEGQWERLKERFCEEIKKNIRRFSDDALGYLASFIDENKKEKKSAYYEIQKVICMFEGKEEISVKTLYKNYIVDAKEELERRWDEEYTL